MVQAPQYLALQVLLLLLRLLRLLLLLLHCLVQPGQLWLLLAWAFSHFPGACLVSCLLLLAGWLWLP
jgi:hypothetical protein